MICSRLILLLLAVLCLGCDRSAAGGATAPVALRVANWGGPGVDRDFLRLEREILEAFEAKTAGVRVQIENIPGPTNQCYVPKLLMMCVAGNPPDVITLDASSSAVFINQDLLLDLTPYVEAELRDPAGFRLSDYAPTVVDIARRGERLYAIPLDFTPMVILYNRRLFDAAGVPHPRPGWTRDDFLSAAKALTIEDPGAPGTARPRQYGFHFQNIMAFWFPWIWAGGSDVLSPDGRHALGHFDSPQTIATIRFLVDLIQTHRVAPNLSEAAALAQDPFRAGKAAMTMIGHWALIEYRKDGLDLGVAAIPRTPRGPRVTVVYEAGLGIARNSRHPDLAWQYLKHLTSAPVQQKRVASGLAISAHRQVADSFRGNPVEDAFLAEVPFARAPWGAKVERYELVEDLGREMMEDILHGHVPVEQAVKRTARLIEAELQRN